MQFTVTTARPDQHKTELAIVAVYEKNELGATAKALDKKALDKKALDKKSGLISSALANGDISGKRGQTLLLTETGGLPCKRILLVGCGKREEFDRGAYRRVLQAAFSTLRKNLTRM